MDFKKIAIDTEKIFIFDFLEYRFRLTRKLRTEVGRIPEEMRLYQSIYRLFRAC